MLAVELKRIVTAFADDPKNVELKHGRIVAQIQDEIVEADLANGEDGELRVSENGARLTPVRWIVNRIARVPVLAERILAHIPSTEHFVVPSGCLQADIAASDAQQEVESVPAALSERVRELIPGSTSVLYLTSDAGEGKTTLINHLARQQATRYKERQADWLLIPIPLGGKAFLHFDDVVIATLVNRLRFNYYYYEGFLELVRLGVVVPAFDGFEEMFVEGSSGEAVSALGNLLNSLDSAGSIVVAARKAFFEYQSFRTQAKLFDVIGDEAVTFSRLSIQRWGKPQFIDYSILRGSDHGEEIYDLVSRRFTASHPLLTRAVLVKRLFDVVMTIEDLQSLLVKLGTRPQDYFFNFVNAIVEREANEKWLDKGGEAKTPLLSIDEHHELLSLLAREMWQTSTFALRFDIIDVIVELFGEQKRKTPGVIRQLRERIRQHSLLTSETSKPNSLAFDHDDFRRFYLGEALGNALQVGSKPDVYSIISVDQVPAETCDQSIQYLSRHRADLHPATRILCEIAKAEPAVSFAKENCGSLLARLISLRTAEDKPLELESLLFPVDALAGRNLSFVTFRECHLQPTSFEHSIFKGVKFISCDFERIELGSDRTLQGATFIECKVSEVIQQGEDAHVFAPHEVTVALLAAGAEIPNTSAPSGPTRPEDPEIRMVEKFLRIFLRNTQVDETIIRARFGQYGPAFVDGVIPRLLKAGVVAEVPYRGGGSQRRFRLIARMQDIQDALESARGDFKGFLAAMVKE